MVAGQYPTREWRDNPVGQIRTIEEAVAIARSFGVVIPDDVEFHVDETGELHKDLTARAPRVDKPSGERVYWSDLVHDITMKVPLRVWPGILKSDEAIVAVLAHEMHEILNLRRTWSVGTSRSTILSCKLKPEGRGTCMTRCGTSPTGWSIG